MKLKKILASAMAAIFVLLMVTLISPGNANAEWQEWPTNRGDITYDDWGLMAGEEKCPGYEGWLNESYKTIWHRYPRCDEISFHEAHQTSRTRLEAWLQQVKFAKFVQHFGGNTFVAPAAGTTAGTVMWFVDGSGVAHRVYDWPTMMAWGLSMRDAYRIPAGELGWWNRIVPKGEALQYWSGPYYDEIENYWADENYDLDMPERLKEEVEANAYNHYGFLKYKTTSFAQSDTGEICDSWWARSPYAKYFDWSYANNLNTETRESCSNF